MTAEFDHWRKNLDCGYCPLDEALESAIVNKFSSTNGWVAQVGRAGLKLVSSDSLPRHHTWNRLVQVTPGLLLFFIATANRKRVPLFKHVFHRPCIKNWSNYHDERKADELGKRQIPNASARKDFSELLQIRRPFNLYGEMLDLQHAYKRLLSATVSFCKSRRHSVFSLIQLR